MKKKITWLITSIIILVSSQGCISKIEVQKADDTTPGIRYFLPQPFLQVTPRTDGGVDVEVVYLPDAENEYAVEAKSIIGNFTIDVNRSAEGFLETVNFNGDSTGVAKQLIASAGNVIAAEVEAKTEKAKAQAVEAKEAAKKESVALEEAENALREAELNLEIAVRKRELLENLKQQGGAPQNINDQIFSAKIAEEEARVRRDSTLKLFEEKVAETSSANAPQVEETILTAPEAVFFKISMTEQDVKLIQDFAQENRDTWRLPKKEAELPDFETGFAEGFSSVLQPDPKTGALSFKIRANRGLLRVQAGNLVNAATKGQVSPSHIFTLQPDGRTVIVDLPISLPAGEYFAEGVLTVGPRGKDTNKSVDIPVRVER